MIGSGSDVRVWNAEELTYSAFYSSKNAQRITIPKYVANLVFLFLIVQKVDKNDISWFFVFSPLILSNLVSFYVKSNELSNSTNTDGVDMKRSRHLSDIFDLLGSFFFKLVFCFYLTKYRTINVVSIEKLTVMLMPTWLSVIFSAILRTTISPSPIIPSFMFSRHKLATVAAALVYLILRGIQPMLVIMRVDSIIRGSWALTFTPSWATAFFGLACAFLLFTFAPFVHSNSSTDLRRAAQLLIYLFAFQVFFGSICSLIFLIHLTQKIDYEYGFSKSKNLAMFDVIFPLVILYVFLIVLHPLFVALSIRYQNELSASILQRLSRPNNNSDALRKPPPQLIKDKTYLMKVASNFYKKINLEDLMNKESARSSNVATSSRKSTLELVNLNQSKTNPSDHDDEKQHDQEWHEKDHLLASIDTTDSATDAKESTVTEVDLQAERHETDGLLCPENTPVGEDIIQIPVVPPFEGQKLTQCVVCLSVDADTVFLHCGHAATCLPCSLAMVNPIVSDLNNAVPSGCCPLCRAVIHRIIILDNKTLLDGKLASSEEEEVRTRESPRYEYEDKELIVSRSFYQLPISAAAQLAQAPRPSVDPELGIQMVTTAELVHALSNAAAAPRTVRVDAVRSSVAYHGAVMDMFA